jgi:hypothetical protein
MKKLILFLTILSAGSFQAIAQMAVRLDKAEEHMHFSRHCKESKENAAKC